MTNTVDYGEKQQQQQKHKRGYSPLLPDLPEGSGIDKWKE